VRSTPATPPLADQKGVAHKTDEPARTTHVTDLPSEVDRTVAVLEGLADAALAYARAGFPVFPVRGKIPATDHGFKDATRDEETIRRWWAANPGAGIGVPMGAVSGLVVLDVDPRHGGDASLEKLLAEHGLLPRGPVVRTGGGGEHRYFAHPGGHLPPVHGFRPGLDLQGDGSYVVAPPSPHASGGTYEWVVPLIGGPRPPLLPAWLLRAAPPPAGSSSAAGPRRFEATPDGMIPHGRHHEWIVSTAASLASRTPGLGETALTRQVRGAMREALDDADAHERDIAHAVRSAIAKYGRAAPPNERRPADSLEPLREAVARIVRCLAHPNASTADGLVPLLLVDLMVDEYGEEVRYDVDSGRFRLYHDGIWPENNTGIGIHLVEEILERIDRWCGDLLHASVTAQWMADWQTRVETARDEATKAGAKGRDLPTREDVPAPPSPVPGIDDGAWQMAVLGAEDLHAFRAERSTRRDVDDAVHILSTRPGIAIQNADLNPDPWTLPIRTGLLDLRSGAVRPFSRSELWTWKSPYAPDPTKPATMWAAFMELFAPDPAVRGYLQRLAYYFLTGSTGEQAVFNLWGPGKNGKTTFIETIAGLIPGAVVRADPATFGEKASDRIPNDLARFRGARLVVVPEPARGLRLNEDLVHRFSGGDMISARFLHREFFDYTPSAKLLFYGSEKLRVIGQSTATWRRLKFVKAVHSFPAPGEPGNLKDYHHAMLAEEGDAILTWALAGREAFLAHGLATPEAIAQDTADLREESDWLAAFLYDCVRPEANSTVAAKTMRSALVGWAIENDEPSVAKTSSRRLSMELEERGYRKSAHHGSAYMWVDVALTVCGLRCGDRAERSAVSVQRTIEEENLVPEGRSRADRARVQWSKNHPGEG